MDNGFTAHEPRPRDPKGRRYRLTRLLLDKGRVTMNCHKAEELAVIGSELTVGGFAQARRLFEHRVEYRREVAGRGVDDLQDLGRCGLLLQGLACLGDQPRVFHRDHSLRSEAPQQGDLRVGKWSHFLSINCDDTEQGIILSERHDDARPCPAKVNQGLAQRAG
jgi:hypothetical protein